MAVTIYEIAEKAGVSSSTVARVLRGYTKGSQARSAETVEKIRRIAEEMGYRTNLRARAFSRRETRGVGLLYTDDAWVFEGPNPIVVNSLSKELQKAGYHLTLAPVDDTGHWDEIVSGGQVDACAAFQILPEAVLSAIETQSLPLVLLGDDTSRDFSSVSVDDFAGAYAATTHLVGLGHRRIVYFTHETIKAHSSVSARLRGFQSALSDAGLEEGVHLQSDADSVSQELLSGAARPTAVLCYSNLEATRLMSALWKLGQPVPERVSIVAFNDLPVTAHLTPPLTTVAFDSERIGALGAEILLEAIAGARDVATRREVLKPRLVVRSSTASPSDR